MFTALQYMSRYTISLIVAVPIAETSTIQHLEILRERNASCLLSPTSRPSVDRIILPKFIQVSDKDMINALRKN